MVPAQHGGPRTGEPWHLEIGKPRNLHSELYDVHTKFDVYYLYMSGDRQTDRQTNRHIGLIANSVHTTKASKQLPHVVKCLLSDDRAAVSVAVCAVRCSEHGLASLVRQRRRNAQFQLMLLRGDELHDAAAKWIYSE